MLRHVYDGFSVGLDSPELTAAKSFLAELSWAPRDSISTTVAGNIFESS